MDRRSIDDTAPRRSEQRELRVDTDSTGWNGMPSPRRVATAPSSPSTAFRTDREAIFRSGNATVLETHVLRSMGMQSSSFTEEHWSSEIKSFIAAAPPKFIQVIKAYRVLSTDMPTLVVEVVSDPPAIFEWFCNDRPVQQDRRRFHARHGLNITTLTVKEPEQGVYKCTARNPAGISTSYGYITVNFEHKNDEWMIVEKSMATEEGQTSVTIHRAPRFINQVPNLTIQPGSQAVIDVEVDAVPPARFLWSVNGREYRESSSNVEFHYPSPNRCVAKFSLPVSGEYKVVASNLFGSAMSRGHVEIHRAAPSKQMRPPVTPGEQLSRNIMTVSRHSRSAAPDEKDLMQTTEILNEVNYYQRSSSVPRAVRHMESHVEMPHSLPRKSSLEQHRAELDSKLPDRLPRALYKTRSEGGVRDLPHPPKFFTTLPSRIAINSREKLVLSVNVSAIPTAEFMWDVNGFEIKSTKNISILNEQNRSTLVVHPPVKQGNYTVTAYNDLGKASITTRVVCETTSIVEQIHKESANPVVVESSVTVTSTKENEWEALNGIDSIPSTTSNTMRSMEPANVHVAREFPITKRRIEERETINEVETYKQMVNGIAVEDERANDLTTRKISETTSMMKSMSMSKSQENIPRRPILLSAPSQNISLAAGETLTLEARVDSTPPATFRWYVNNFEVKNGPLSSITQPVENVSIASFTKPVTGQYKVVASNFLGEVTAITRVTSEVLKEEQKERTIITSVEKPAKFAVGKKPTIITREDLPKPPRFVGKLPAVLKISFSEPVTLRVTVDAVPEATFLWLFNNFELKQNSNVQIKRVAANVSELSLQRGQHGRYDVVAKNSMGQDSCSCKVIVEHRSEPCVAAKPSFIRPLSTETTMCSEEETKLEVVVSGTPPFNFIWLLNGTEIRSEEHFHIVTESNKSNLTLRKPPENGSVIEVNVEDRNGSARSGTVIRLISKTADRIDEKRVIDKTPKFVENLENQSLHEGDTLKCRVKINGDSEPCTFEWYANELRIISGDHVLIESNTHESSLTIENMGEMTDVKLSALAQNQHGTSITSANLNVIKRPDESFEMVSGDLPEELAPKIIEPLHSASFIKGQPMLLRCRIEAVPSAVITWKKDDINVEEWVINKDVITRVLPGGICEMMNPEVCPEDSGLYKCTATNSHGTAETAAYINVAEGTYQKSRDDASASESASLRVPEKVDTVPKFVEQLNAETDGAYDLNYIRLVCRISSPAPVKVSWWKDGVEIVSSEKYEFHEFSDGALILTIHAPNASDNGVYICKAESIHGISSSSCEVLVPTRTITTEKMTESSSQRTTVIEQHPQIYEERKEDYVATTEITKREEEYKLLVKVADTVASALVANVFVDAVHEAVKRIIVEESEEEEEIEVKGSIPRFDSSIERCVVKENETVTITTVVSGVPTPFIEWYFEKEKLYVTNQISMGYENKVATLILKNVTQEQEGTYYCRATNPHGTTVLPTHVKVISENAGDTIRLTLAKYDTQEKLEQVVTNIYAHHEEEKFEEIVKHTIPRKAAESAFFLSIPKIAKTVQSTEQAVQATEQDVQRVEKAVETAESLKRPAEKPVEQAVQTAEQDLHPPIPPPRKHVRKEQKDVSVAVEKESTSKVAADKPEVQAQESMRLITIRFAETLTKHLMSQAQTDFVTIVSRKKGSARATRPSEAKADSYETKENVATLLVEGEAGTIGDVTPLRLVTPSAQRVIRENTAISLKEVISEEMTTVDVRKPNAQFDHLVTVVEPELVQFGLRLSSSTASSMKFIDLETILQRPGTSSSADTLISSPHKGSANVEHRIVMLEGASQNFKNAITWSLKKVRKLGTEMGEPSTSVQIEILKPNESSEEVLTIMGSEKVKPDLLRVAAASSKIKMENVTVSLVKQGDTAHEELVIEYENRVEDSVDFNLSKLVYSSQQEESRRETWSRRSRFSEVEENVVVVFVEVNATCPEQNIEIVASVNIPLETKVDRQSSPEALPVSVSLTESSNATGQQPPKFFRMLQDRNTTVGKSVQFKCMVSGMPTPKITWYVDGDVIQQSKEYDIVYEDGVCILRINEVLAEDEGEYSCEASNVAGKAETKCFLKVMNKQSSGFIVHAPSMTELIDGRDSLDSFEWEEQKANKLFSHDTVSQHSLVTYNSEFDLSKIVSYNENMEETNAFHKYFDTGEAIVHIKEVGPYERLFASFLVHEPERVSVDVVIPKPPAFIAVPHRIPFFVVEGIHAHFTSSQAAQGNWSHVVTPEEHGCSLENERTFTRDKCKPRELDLPQEMYYKGRKIAMSVNEIEKDEIAQNENGDVKIFKRTCLETSLEFDAEVDISQSIRKIYNALPNRNACAVLKQHFENQTFKRAPSSTTHTAIRREHPPVDPSSQIVEYPTSFNSELTELRGMEKLQSPMKSDRSASKDSTVTKCNLVNPELIAKIREVERIACEVKEELEPLSSPQFSHNRDGAKEIEDAIFKISDDLLLSRPITEAQAEASEELFRTTLTDMILNPTQNAEEEIELIRRPIRLLRRKFSEVANSFIEDEDVTIITDEVSAISPSDTSADSSVRPQSQYRTEMPTSEYLRVTPLTCDIKDELSQLEETIAIPMSSGSSEKEDGCLEVVKGGKQKKKELHDLFMQINNEMNTIKSFCKPKLSKKGTDAVMSVLHKVRLHVASIANVMSLTRAKQSKPIEKSGKSASIPQSERTPAYQKIDVGSNVEQPLVHLEECGIIEEKRNNNNLAPTEENAGKDGIPIAPPRRRSRALSAQSHAVGGQPIRPFRNKDTLRTRDHSLDSRISVTDKTPCQVTAVMDARSSREESLNSSSFKSKKSFGGGKQDIFRRPNCVKSPKEVMDTHLEQVPSGEASPNIENKRLFGKDLVNGNQQSGGEVVVRVSYEGSFHTAAYLQHTEARATVLVPLPNTTTLLVSIFADDGGSSVQMVCEESDYATDTDNSALLRGTVQFFNRNSPKNMSLPPTTSLSASQRNPRILLELPEKNEPNNVCITADIDIHCNTDACEGNKAVEFTYAMPVVRTGSPASTINPEDTIHIVLEETLLSQMGSSLVTDDSDRTVELRETDILSDDSVLTEIDQGIVDSVYDSFEFFRPAAKKGLVAVLSQDVRQYVSVNISVDCTFEVEITQEPRDMSVMVNVIEDQVNFTSLTVNKPCLNNFGDDRVCDEITDNSFNGVVNGESRTGISVSIIARSLHDGVYASLEEIPWGEVNMTLPECDAMAKSVEEDSKTSVLFNVTVSESNLEEKKSLLSQASLNQSQNTISEIDNTLSTGSISIPSYVIKIGSTATITCELNNYLPPNSKIDWYRGDMQIDTCPGKLDRISHDLLEVLIINDVQKEDNELYSLKVNNEIFPVAYLIVEPASVESLGATIITPPQTQFIMEGQPTVIMCQVSSPYLAVRWLKDRKPLQESDRLRLEVGEDGFNRVVFSQTQISDQGTYLAVLGEQSVTITLVVEERIDEKEVTVVASGTESEEDDVQEYLVPPGSTATIACELEDGDHMCSLVWLKNGQRLTFNDPNKMEHVKNSLKHYLVIHDTCAKDSGLYSVSISDVEFRVAHLTVNDMATISNSLRRKRISNSSLH